MTSLGEPGRNDSKGWGVTRVASVGLFACRAGQLEQLFRLGTDYSPYTRGIPCGKRGGILIHSLAAGGLRCRNARASEELPRARSARENPDRDHRVRIDVRIRVDRARGNRRARAGLDLGGALSEQPQLIRSCSNSRRRVNRMHPPANCSGVLWPWRDRTGGAGANIVDRRPRQVIPYRYLLGDTKRCP
jgi:hypothetical protein